MNRTSDKKLTAQWYRNLLKITKLRLMPLRTRLNLAFVILIISSASATIIIGSMVFGSKVEELARGKVTLYNNVANQVFNLHLEKMRLLAIYVASHTGPDGPADSVLENIADEAPLDFIAFFSEDRLVIARSKTDDPSRSQTVFDTTIFFANAVARTRKSPLGRPVELALASNSALAGVAMVPDYDLKALGFAKLDRESLLMLAAAPIGNSGNVILLGWILNGRKEILSEMEALISPPEAEIVDATIFLRDKRIATNIGGEALGTHADIEVSEAVLGHNETFTGKAKVLGEFFFTVYTPLEDFEGNIVGMMGTGTNENVYDEVKRRTTLLFSSLIAGGMVFGFIMTYLFSVWLIRPVTYLAEGMSRVAEGDLSYKVRISSNDELGRLARAFNKMVKAVKERDYRLCEITENRLSAVEKQISIGRLAAGVAHEINNPLTAILSLSRLMLKHSAKDDPEHEDLEIIVTETTRCREIVRSLLNFARENPVDKHIVEINQVVRDAVSLTDKYDAMDGVDVSLDISAIPFFVDADPKMLQQVFINILLNSAEAIEGKGAIKISTMDDSSGSFVQVSFQDSGKGIPKEHIKRVFEPFFTTKGAGKGTGLGLSVSIGIIRKHEGSIEIQSKEGEGTTVTVILSLVSHLSEGDSGSL
jgi:two-component system, NtrC family, sensor kinase